MSIGKRVREQPALRIGDVELSEATGHPFYSQFNRRLDEHFVDRLVEDQ